MQAANQVVNALCGPLPVNEAVLFREPGRIGRGAVGLRCSRAEPSAMAFRVDDEQPGTEQREIAFDLFAGFVWSDRACRTVGDHRARVERLDDPHDGHAGHRARRPMIAR